MFPSNQAKKDSSVTVTFIATPYILILKFPFLTQRPLPHKFKTRVFGHIAPLLKY